MFRLRLKGNIDFKLVQLLACFSKAYFSDCFHNLVKQFGYCRVHNFGFLDEAHYVAASHEAPHCHAQNCTFHCRGIVLVSRICKVLSYNWLLTMDAQTISVDHPSYCFVGHTCHHPSLGSSPNPSFLSPGSNFILGDTVVCYNLLHRDSCCYHVIGNFHHLDHFGKVVIAVMLIKLHNYSDMVSFEQRELGD